MLETWNLVRMYIHIRSFKKYTFSTKALLILLMSAFFDMTSLTNFFDLVKFSYWSKFHVNIITDSGVLTIFFCKSLTRNQEIRNTTLWVLTNIWRLGWFGDTKLGTNVSKKMLLNAAKCHGYNFYPFWVS